MILLALAILVGFLAGLLCGYLINIADDSEVEEARRAGYHEGRLDGAATTANRMIDLVAVIDQARREADRLRTFAEQRLSGVLSRTGGGQ